MELLTTAVIFDLDGTLIDSLEDIAESMNAVLAGHGLPIHPLQAYKNFVGGGMKQLVARAAPPGHPDPESLATDMRVHYAGRWAQKTRPYPGVSEVLSRLAGRGFRLAVLSNKPHAFTVDLVAYFFPGTSFSAVLGSRPGTPTKPDPMSALEIAGRLAVGPREMAIVGDSDVDMQTASAAGMRPIGAGWGFRTSQELVAAGAEQVARQPVDLLQVLGL